MAGGIFRVFISAVTSEFGRARDGLAADLRSRGLQVHVQSDFRQEAEAASTLQKLQLYISRCDAVVCILGKRSGSLAPAAPASEFAHILPVDFDEVSYTQWEFFFARHYRRRLSIYLASKDYQPDTSAADDRAELQQKFVRYVIDERGSDYTAFSNEDQLCRAVHKEPWPRSRWQQARGLPDGELKIIYDLYRTAYLNQKYYGYRLNQTEKELANGHRDPGAAAPILRSQREEYDYLFRGYAEATSTLRFVIEDVRVKRGISSRALADYRRARRSVIELEKKDEPNPDRKLIKRFEREVNQEVPPGVLWFPGGA